MLITTLYAGPLALWFVMLSARIALGRRLRKLSVGDGGDPMFERMIRAQANFAEYTPLCLLLLTLLELNHYPPLLLHALGLALLIGRLLHGYALGFARHFMLGRVLGIALTFGVLIVEGVLCLHLGLGTFG